MTTLVSVIALLTAIVMASTKIVELVSAVKKSKEASKTPTDVAATSPASRRTSKLPGIFWWNFWSNLFFTAVSLGYLLYYMFLPSAGPATRQEIASIGLIVGIYVVSSVMTRVT